MADVPHSIPLLDVRLIKPPLMTPARRGGTRAAVRSPLATTCQCLLVVQWRLLPLLGQGYSVPVKIHTLITNSSLQLWFDSQQQSAEPSI